MKKIFILVISVICCMSCTNKQIIKQKDMMIYTLPKGERFINSYEIRGIIYINTVVVDSAYTPKIYHHYSSFSDNNLKLDYKIVEQ